MPLPTDEKVVKLANDILAVLQKLFGPQPGFRRVHSKGILLKGTFTSALDAASLTSAPHIERQFTPVVVRYSDTTGVPMIPDNDPNASPRGCAIRFYLADHIHTDIVAHSTNAFPAKNGEEFLELLRALAAGKMDAFAASHPAAVVYATAPKPNAVSYATEAFFSVVAFKFINQEGKAQFGRYRFIPQGGTKYLDGTAAKAKGPNYLFDDIKERIAKGPIKFDIRVQLAEKGDVVDDATKQWPESRRIVPFGTVTLTELAPEDETHKKIIFDPIPRVEGIESSGDPLLELRAAAYLLAGRARRQELASEAPIGEPA